MRSSLIRAEDTVAKGLIHTSASVLRVQGEGRQMGEEVREANSCRSQAEPLRSVVGIWDPTLRERAGAVTYLEQLNGWGEYESKTSLRNPEKAVYMLDLSPERP